MRLNCHNHSFEHQYTFESFIVSLSDPRHTLKYLYKPIWMLIPHPIHTRTLHFLHIHPISYYICAWTTLSTLHSFTQTLMMQLDCSIESREALDSSMGHLNGSQSINIQCIMLEWLDSFIPCVPHAVWVLFIIIYHSYDVHSSPSHPWGHMGAFKWSCLEHTW